MSVKLVRKPRSPKILHRIIRQAVIDELKPVAKAATQSYEKVVGNWDNKPKFKTDIKVTEKDIEIITVVRRGQRLKNGDATTADLWKWIDKTGTKAHPIPKQPKQKGFLVFPWGGPGSYKSKTGARPARYGGPGTVANATTQYRKQVQHPGFEARHFSDAINTDLREDFDRAVDRGYRKGFAKVSR